MKAETGMVASAICSCGSKAAPTSPPVPMAIGPAEPPMAEAMASSSAARLASGRGKWWSAMASHYTCACWVKSRRA
jgi:hypothetical protein